MTTNERAPAMRLVERKILGEYVVTTDPEMGWDDDLPPVPRYRWRDVLRFLVPAFLRPDSDRQIP